MEKSKHIYRNSKIPYEELTNFIEPIEMTIPIYYNSFNNLVDPRTDNQEKLEKYVKDRYLELFSKLPFLKSYYENSSESEQGRIKSISYTPHTDGYDFRFHPVDITNYLFHSLGYKVHIPFMNLDDKQSRAYLYDLVGCHCLDLLDREIDPNKRMLLYEIKDNYSKILAMYDEPADIKDMILPKNALFFLAYASLDKYEKNKDIKRLVLAKEYYDEVSHMQTSDYPFMIQRRQTNRMVWFGDFRREYEENVPEDLELPIDSMRLRNAYIYVGFEILKPGEVDKELVESVKRTRTAANVDYEKYRKLFEQKMNFYSRSPYKEIIKGLYGLMGYRGYVYPNEYLLFDKLYNTDYEDITKRTILTHAEATYALPSDRFSLITDSTKQEIIEEKKRDPRIRKFNHTNTIFTRLQSVIDGPNLSTSTIEEEKKNAKVLIRRL